MIGLDIKETSTSARKAKDQRKLKAEAQRSYFQCMKMLFKFFDCAFFSKVIGALVN